MKKVGIRELKDKLSAYVREAQAGEVVQVTDHGHVVAELRPPGEVEDRGLTPYEVRHRQLVAEGFIIPAKKKGRFRFSDLPRLGLPKGLSEQLLDAERGE